MIRARCPKCHALLVDDQSVYGCRHVLAGDLREEFDERAAILEFEAGLRRSDAERQARELIAQRIRERSDADTQQPPT